LSRLKFDKAALEEKFLRHSLKVSAYNTLATAESDAARLI